MKARRCSVGSLRLSSLRCVRLCAQQCKAVLRLRHRYSLRRGLTARWNCGGRLKAGRHDSLRVVDCPASVVLHSLALILSLIAKLANGSSMPVLVCGFLSAVTVVFAVGTAARQHDQTRSQRIPVER